MFYLSTDFQIFVALLKTFGMQTDDMDHISLEVFQNGDMQNGSFQWIGGKEGRDTDRIHGVRKWQKWTDTNT